MTYIRNELIGLLYKMTAKKYLEMGGKIREIEKMKIGGRAKFKIGYKNFILTRGKNTYK
tara:strand:+ start:296 stop:472 length:177 start_codon:yes stop_codon:yes gene_type:complete